MSQDYYLTFPQQQCKTSLFIMLLLKSGRQAFSVLFSICMLMLSANSYAEDTLISLMQKMQSDTAVKMVYQEIRKLELIDQPWHGSGYMYSISPDLMIREQIKPQRLLMGIKGDQMLYFDPENNLRYQGEMTEDNPLSLNIAVFKALINADEVLLKKMYLITFISKPQRWLMTLKPKHQSGSEFKIIVSGLSGKAADTIVTKQVDGDLSEFMLQPYSVGEEVKNKVSQLYKELVGE